MIADDAVPVSSLRFAANPSRWGRASMQLHGRFGANLRLILGFEFYQSVFDIVENSHADVCKLRSSGNPGKMLWTSGRQVNGTSCKEPFVWKLSNNAQLPLSSFTHWYPGEPNCLGKDEPCVHLTPTDDFLWSDTTCSEMLCPLCEYDLP